MTPGTSVTNVSTAFITATPLVPSAQRTQIVRRPRHSPREGDSACRCRISRPRVRCASTDEGDDESATRNRKKGQWLQGAWKWPKGEEQTKKEEIAEVVEDKVIKEKVTSTAEESRTPFRWPWQKEPSSVPSSEENGVDLETKASKRITHSDSKPGASLNGNGIRKEKKQGLTLQERWEGFIEVIVPNMTKEDKEEKKVDGKTSTVGSSLRAEESNSTGSSVRELYQPPAEASEDVRQPEAQREQSKRFRWPWSRDEEEENMKSSKIEDRESEKEKVEEPSALVSHRPGLKVSRIEEKKPSDANIVKREVEIVEASADVITEKRSANEKTDEPSSRDDSKKGETEPELVGSSKGKIKLQSLDMVSIPQKDVAAIRLIFGSETFFATETLSPPGGLIFRGNLRGEPKATLAKLEERLKARLGDKYTLCLAEGEEDLRPVVVVVPTARDTRPATIRQRYIAVIIALLTVTTIMTRGVYAAIYKPMIQTFYPADGTAILERLFAYPNTIAITVSVAIGIAVIISQIVQRIVASHHRTRIALPYFIPSVQLGSFGAVVQLASPTPTRAALFDIALAGPATLAILSLVCLLIGLKLSTVFPMVVPVPISTVSNSVLIGFLTQQVPNGQILVDYGRSLIGLHPLAVIGANCLTIAALSLLPIRQLDGGRIISALYGRRTGVVASRVTVLFLLLASTKSPYFVVFLAAITFGPWHLDRPSKNEVTEPNAFRTIVGYLFMLLMISVLLPFPASKFFGTQ